MIYFFTTVLVVGVIAIALGAVIGWYRARIDKNAKALLESERALGRTERALRNIANGSETPILEAQIALDEISNYHDKELNQ